MQTQLKFSKKHKIKEDAFIEKVLIARQWVMEHGKQISTGIAVCLIAVFVAFFVYKSRENQRAKAQDSFGVAMLAYQHGDTLSAVADFRNITAQHKKTPFGPLSAYMLGSIYFNQTDYGQAQTYYDRCMDLIDDDTFLKGACLNGLANSHIQQKKYSEALVFLNQFITDCPKHYLMPDVLLSAGECQQRLKDNAAAENLFKRLKTEFPGTAQAKTAENLLATL